MKEGLTKTMTLEDTTPAAFGQFVHWCYATQLNDYDVSEPSVETLLDLWLLADKAMVPGLQNEVICAINNHKDLSATLQTQDFMKIWEQTSHDSPLLEFLVLQLVYRAHGFIHGQKFPHSLWVRLFNYIRIAKFRSLEAPLPMSLIKSQFFLKEVE